MRAEFRLRARSIVATALLTFCLMFAFDSSAATGPGGVSPWPGTTVVASRVLRVGLRNDAKPFSYRSKTDASESILEGYRGYMVEICRRVLRNMTNSGPFRGYSVEVATIEAKDRFPALAAGDIDLLCGPDSITSSRMRSYAVSHPMFVSGLTYAYLDPKRREFPRARHCGNIIGVVRGTTAESSGLRMMADEGLLLRFDQALEVYLAWEPELTLRKQQATDAVRRNYAEGQYYLRPDGRKFAMELEDAIRKAQSRSADLFVTDECPKGFVDGLPVRLFANHDEGIRELCAGEVLYYLGDYDIITRKIDAAGDCPVVIERFTQTKEVYGAFFRADFDNALGPAGQVDVRAAHDALLYAVFNHTLLRMMQAQTNILEFEFEREFGNAEKSEDLLDFFESFRMVSDR